MHSLHGWISSRRSVSAKYVYSEFIMNWNRISTCRRWCKVAQGDHRSPWWREHLETTFLLSRSCLRVTLKELNDHPSFPRVCHFFLYWYLLSTENDIRVPQGSDLTSVTWPNLVEMDKNGWIFLLNSYYPNTGLIGILSLDQWGASIRLFVKICAFFPLPL